MARRAYIAQLQHRRGRRHPGTRLDCPGELGDRPGVDALGLAAAELEVIEVVLAGGIDYADRDAVTARGHGEIDPVAPSRLDADTHSCVWVLGEPCYQVGLAAPGCCRPPCGACFRPRGSLDDQLARHNRVRLRAFQQLPDDALQHAEGVQIDDPFVQTKDHVGQAFNKMSGDLRIFLQECANLALPQARNQYAVGFATTVEVRGRRRSRSVHRNAGPVRGERS